MDSLLILETILSAILGSIIILPFLLLLYLTNQVVRAIVKLLLWSVYDTEIILNPNGYDSMYMYDLGGKGKRTVLYLAVLNNLNNNEGSEEFDIEGHRKDYMKCIINKPSFQKLCSIFVSKWGYCCLKKDKTFDIANHVKLYEENNNGKDIVTEDELMGDILPELSKDLDDTKPQWEEIIVPRFSYRENPEELKCLRILRIHHGFMDGVSHLLMIANSQNEGGISKFPWVIDPLKQPKTHPFKKILFNTFCMLNLAGACVKNLLSSPKFTQNNRWNVKKLTGRTVYGWTKPLEVETLHKIKQATGCSMPSIVLTILTSALRKFELEFSEKEVSEEIVVGLVAALLPYQSLELQNNHCILKCHLDSRDLPRRVRLWSIQEELKRVGRRPDIYLNNWLPNLYGQMPLFISNPCTGLISGAGVISNFPVTKQRLNLWGRDVNEMAGWVPLITRAGFACVTLRYSDQLRFCFNADEASMSAKQLDFLLEKVSEECSLLLHDLCGTRAQSSKGSLVGRFIVTKVEDSKDSSLCSKNNDDNFHSKREKLIVLPRRRRSSVIGVHVRKQLTRESRLNAAIERVLYTMNKLKRA